jgi:hypothetical protein
MKRSKFTQAQIAFILRQGEEGTAVARSAARPGLARTRPDRVPFAEARSAVALARHSLLQVATWA